jgi:hypothetical protein
MAERSTNGKVASPRLTQVRHGLVAGLRKVGLAQPAPPPPPTPGPPGSSGALGESDLAKRRTGLAERFAQLQWDLGGLVYEMASRDVFRREVLIARAAELQQVEAELAEAERLLRLEEGGAAGACPSCGSLYARGAVFCWHCGTRLLQSPTPDAPTAQWTRT